jgi:hypothetical protein
MLAKFGNTGQEKKELQTMNNPRQSFIGARGRLMHLLDDFCPWIYRLFAFCIAIQVMATSIKLRLPVTLPFALGKFPTAQKHPSCKPYINSSCCSHA